MARPASLLVVVVAAASFPVFAQPLVTAARAVDGPERLLLSGPLESEVGSDAEEDEGGAVVELEAPLFYLAVTQVVAVPPEDPQAPPEFEPGFKLAWRVLPHLAVGAEYLATFGPVAQLSALEEQSHRLFGAIDVDWLTAGRRFGLNLALGYDVTGPEQWVGRLVLCFDLDPQVTAPAPR